MASDSVNLSHDVFGQLVDGALKLRDLTTGAAALLGDDARPSQATKAARELISRARTSANAIVATLEREFNGTTARTKRRRSAK